MKSTPYGNSKSLIFAPMEGVTDEPYRMAIGKLFPEWDYYSTDFYRVPTVGNINAKRVHDHFGARTFQNEELRKKTTYQILTTARAQTEQVVQAVSELNVDHLDLNLGCPSKKVNAHKGGAYLLSDLEELKRIIRLIRSNFKKTFTVKIRIGYRDDSSFEDSLKLFEDEGVEAITLHARTRDQLYQGIADWEYIKKAVKLVNIPIIGNGDIWSVHDVNRMFDETDCHAVMIGRGALKTPWLATLFYEHQNNLDFISDEYLLDIRKDYLDLYFYELEKEYRKLGLDDHNILKRFKSFSRYLFDDYADGEIVRGRFLRSMKLDEFLSHLDRL
ncbi:tRNA-dihydrouridine synthase family protein [Halobacteriovorax sp. GB3]|uniref:tRNA dihydrouridine synthase n=1 Tax=Halobacteriovorax sp. GB3 TaxID=2719615 RepID=UPI00236232FB|nr:tRNA-dihydrouridine synthase family protein [Halobacteriovorax sp. GB3]MDD0854424.1 tRNA-dihydrouridine synthase family protein [Halobacteriovorax sp. GB3]